MLSNEVISVILAMEPVVDRLIEEFFNTDVIKFKSGVEGQAISDDGTILLGDRAGPYNFEGSYSISNICHEMAHLVEIDDTRMRMPGWGLKVRSINVLGRKCYEPQDDRITCRELRVAAYQLHLLEYLGVSKTVTDIVDSFDWLPDNIHVRIADGRKPYGEHYEVIKAEGVDIEKSQMQWRINESTMVERQS